MKGKDMTTENNLELTTSIVTAYVSNNSVVATDVPSLIADVFDALSKAARVSPGGTLEDLKPAVPVSKSITPDFLVCLEDGKKFKSLKRHLRSYYDLSPEQYREKWSLPHNYPMVAPNYAAKRSKLAREMGLGQRG
jgi:predicted transcriptional regulator